ncbi:hypothetical protein AMATHDRAFT_6987 [Amanita thiersii Skay4041]|uniref:Uncharacterized protein n=1 Tax=Amanita thiersii Skay4041 TaxID=703135 RepID=A0A2A9ND17_9AGAR|nr:hypothetical protein AMATHDRAFT_6987 [Amanita thiersii Skay4041]
MSGSGEQIQQSPWYSTASVASCNWVNGGRDKIDPAKLHLYVSRLSSSAAYGRVVGVGYKTTAGVITPIIRLDMDNTGKGIHFNAVQLSNPSRKLAAVITPTVGKTPAERTQLYMEYIKGLENRSAQFIWNWWLTGVAN